LPNASRNQDWRVKIQTHSPAWQGFGWRGWFFSPLTDNFYILAQLFSNLASENFSLLASSASVLKNLSTPVVRGSNKSQNQKNKEQFKF
jgi:hypothetical protein